MDVVLIVLAVAGCVFLSVLTIERGIAIWSRLKPMDDRWHVLESDHVELKTFTHSGIHQLRTDLRVLDSNAQTVASWATERLARLEQKTDSQTETLDKMLRMIETAFSIQRAQ